MTKSIFAAIPFRLHWLLQLFKVAYRLKNVAKAKASFIIHWLKPTAMKSLIYLLGSALADLYRDDVMALATAQELLILLYKPY
jgi:hypothetical protein